MKKTQILMNMPISVEIIGEHANAQAIKQVFNYFKSVEERFSVFRKESEISRFNRGEIKKSDFSKDLRTIFRLSEKTKKETNGYFDIKTKKGYNPSGLVKGWAINEAAQILRKKGFKNFYIDAGGDIEAVGKNKLGKKWRVGVRNPFKVDEIVKILSLSNRGIATSGTSMRGAHIYNPHKIGKKIPDIISITVIGPNILEADRFATAAFAMGKEGINFIEKRKGLEAYMIDKNGLATYTSNFPKFVVEESAKN